MKRMRAYLRARRTLRSRKRVLVALAVLDQTMQSAHMSRTERRRMFREIIAESKWLEM